MGGKLPDPRVRLPADHLPASETASSLMESSRQMLRRQSSSRHCGQESADGCTGGIRHTHRVARDESCQLIAQTKSGCEDGFLKKKKGILFSRKHLASVLAPGRERGGSGQAGGPPVSHGLGAGGCCDPGCSHCLAQ